MTRKDFDARDFSINRATDSRQRALNQAAKDVTEKLPGNWTVKIGNFDATTGDPIKLISEFAPTTEKGNYIQQALEFLNSVKSAQGFEESQAAEFKADPIVKETSANAKVVHLKQTSAGIPVFQGGMTVHFGPDDRIKEAAGYTASFTKIPEVSPKLSAKDAVMIVAKYLEEPDPEEQQATDQFGEPLTSPRVDLTGFEPKAEITLQSDPSKTTFFEQGPFASRIKASMVWFELAPNDMRLAWEVMTTMPNFAGQYLTIVDGIDGKVLFNQDIMNTLRARMNVYRVDGGRSREMIECPVGLDAYPLSNYSPPPLPNGFPDDWCGDDQRSVGNNVYARFCHDEECRDSKPPIQGAVKNGIIVFDPADPTGEEQLVLNIFYFNCYLHDYFYFLGFREKDANFQQDNLNRGGTPGDRVVASAHPRPIRGTATMGWSVEGESPIMRMGLVGRTNRHTGLDIDVLAHEFTHGVANRLVGGGVELSPLLSPQSRGFNEGNSDHFACTINKTIAVGSWVTNNPSSGIRKYPYDSNFPHNFGHLGTVTDGVNYTGINPDGSPAPHPVGTIWAATVVEMNRNIGDELGAQLVLDALKIVHTNPSFLNMRDFILTALDDKLTANPPMDRSEHKKVWNGIWKAFAKFGMGPGARSNGAQLSGIETDFSVPHYPQG